MKKIFLFSALLCFSYFLNAAPAIKDQIQFGTFAIDINSITDINPAINKIALYCGLRSASDPLNSACYVLAPVTVPMPYNNNLPPSVIKSNPVFCLQNSGGCPTVCDINQLICNSTTQLLENRNQDYMLAGLATIINNFTNIAVNPSYSNQYNAIVLNQAYLLSILAMGNATNIIVMVGVSQDGKSLQITYYAVDANKRIIFNSIMTETAPLAYYNAKV